MKGSVMISLLKDVMIKIHALKKTDLTKFVLKMTEDVPWKNT